MPRLWESRHDRRSSHSRARRHARRATPARRSSPPTVGYAMDGFDLLILGFMLPRHLGRPRPDAAAGRLRWSTWTLIGAVVGGIVLRHRSATIYGRVRVLTWTILLFAVFTGLCALAQGYWDLLVYRTIAGHRPRRRVRHRHGAGRRSLAGPSSAPACRPTWRWAGRPACWRAALLTPLLLPSIGWRGMFVVGVLPAVAAFVDPPLRRRAEDLRRASKAQDRRARWLACSCW